MKVSFVLLALVVLALAGFASAADFEAKCRLVNPTADKSFNCTLYGQDVGQEKRFRIDVCYIEDGANSICESIIQRFNWNNTYGGQVSSQMIIGEPWTAFRQCCQHDALGTQQPPTITPLTGETFNIVRSDNYTLVEIVTVEDTPTAAVLEESILRNWDNALEVCDIKCKVPMDVVFNIDNSGSISGSDFLKMAQFIELFIERFTVSSSFAQVGMVLFSGSRSNPRSSTQQDLTYLPSRTVINGTETTAPYHGDSSATETYWTNAVTNAAWPTNVPWNTPTLQRSQYYTGFNAFLNTVFGGHGFVELEMTPFEFRIQETIAKLGNGRTRFYDRQEGWTAIGTGFVLANELLFRNTNAGRSVPAVNMSNGFPRLIITMADGGNNRGLAPSQVKSQVSAFTPNLTMVSIGIGNVNTGQMLNMADTSDDYYYVDTFSSMVNILDSLVSGTCLGSSDNAAPCDPSCAVNGGMCTACGTCVQCTTDEECGQCSFCSQSPFGTCITDAAAAASKCEPPTPCQSASCDVDSQEDNGCVYTGFLPELVDAGREECEGADGEKPFTFDADACTCTANPGDGDGGVTAGVVAGGAVAGSILILIILAALAAVLALLLIAAIFIVVAVVVAAIAMLAFGVTMAIPPTIAGTALTAPTQVVNDENPLAVDQMEWVESAAGGA